MAGNHQVMVAYVGNLIVSFLHGVISFPALETDL